MNKETLANLCKHIFDAQTSGTFGIREYKEAISTSTCFGTDDDVTLPSGKYLFAYTDDVSYSPIPNFCLPLQKEMYDEGFVHSHQVLIWII